MRTLFGTICGIGLVALFITGAWSHTAWYYASAVLTGVIGLVVLMVAADEWSR